MNSIHQSAFYTSASCCLVQNWGVTASVTLQLSVALMAEEILKDYVLWFFTDSVREAWQGGFSFACWKYTVAKSYFWSFLLKFHKLLKLWVSESILQWLLTQNEIFISLLKVTSKIKGINKAHFWWRKQPDVWMARRNLVPLNMTAWSREVPSLVTNDGGETHKAVDILYTGTTSQKGWWRGEKQHSALKSSSPWICGLGHSAFLCLPFLFCKWKD